MAITGVRVEWVVEDDRGAIVLEPKSTMLETFIDECTVRFNNGEIHSFSVVAEEDE